MRRGRRDAGGGGGSPPTGLPLGPVSRARSPLLNACAGSSRSPLLEKIKFRFLFFNLWGGNVREQTRLWYSPVGFFIYFYGDM